MLGWRGWQRFRTCESSPQGATATPTAATFSFCLGWCYWTYMLVGIQDLLRTATESNISKPGMSCAGLYRSVQACTSLTDVQESPPYTGLYRFVQTSFVCTNSIIFADKRNVTYHFWPSHLTWVMWPISHIIICHWQELNPWPQGNNYPLLPLSHKTFGISQH